MGVVYLRKLSQIFNAHVVLLYCCTHDKMIQQHLFGLHRLLLLTDFAHPMMLDLAGSPHMTQRLWCSMFQKTPDLGHSHRVYWLSYCHFIIIDTCSGIVTDSLQLHTAMIEIKQQSQIDDLACDVT